MNLGHVTRWDGNPSYSRPGAEQQLNTMKESSYPEDRNLPARSAGERSSGNMINLETEMGTA